MHFIDPWELICGVSRPDMYIALLMVSLVCHQVSDPSDLGQGVWQTLYSALPQCNH